MNKSNIFIKGRIIKPGLYWMRHVKSSMVLVGHLYKDELWQYGHYGNAPITQNGQQTSQTDKLFEHMPIKSITQNAKWVYDERFNKNNIYAWIKDAEGYIGFGLLHFDYHAPRGTIIYLNHPVRNVMNSEWFRKEDGYRFADVRLWNEDLA